MSAGTATVVAVTVTYGDRFRYLRQVLLRLRGERSVRAVVVVDNGATAALATQIAALRLGDFVQLLHMGKNLGSAVGYACALRHALTLDGVSHAYLLDDDNLPAPGAIDLLAQLARSHAPQTAFVSYRPSRIEHRRLREQGIPVAMQAPNSFIGFSLPGALRQRLWPRARVRDAARATLQSVDYAPYGGFFFALDQLRSLGLPRAEFVLYADDHEFTHRFVRAGGKILLCPDSLLHDLEPSMHGTTRARIPPLFDPNNAEFRVYYSTRNRVAFERELLVRSVPVYWANAAISLAVNLGRARAAGVPARQLARRGRLLLAALRAGWQGELGPCARMPMPGS